MSNRRFSARKTRAATLLQGLCVCADCGYGMGRNSTRTSGARLHHYYRCHGRDGWRHPDGPVCDNPPVRADDLDQAVWNAVFALLEAPDRIQSELRRRIAAARDTAPARQRVADLQGERSHCQAQSRRLLDAYQESLVDLDALRARNEPLRARLRAIEAELQSLQSAELERASGLTVALNVSQFLERMREGEHTMAVADRQRLIRLLVREVQVGKDGVTIRHSIPLDRPTGQGPGSPSGCPPSAGPGERDFLNPRRAHPLDSKGQGGPSGGARGSGLRAGGPAWVPPPPRDPLARRGHGHRRADDRGGAGERDRQRTVRFDLRRADAAGPAA